MIAGWLLQLASSLRMDCNVPEPHMGSRMRSPCNWHQVSGWIATSVLREKWLGWCRLQLASSLRMDCNCLTGSLRYFQIGLAIGIRSQDGLQLLSFSDASLMRSDQPGTVLLLTRVFFAPHKGQNVGAWTNINDSNAPPQHLRHIHISAHGSQRGEPSGGSLSALSRTAISSGVNPLDPFAFFTFTKL